jgi:hypothetical protein
MFHEELLLVEDGNIKVNTIDFKEKCEQKWTAAFSERAASL